MIIELKNLFNDRDVTLKLDHTVDLTDYEFGGTKPFTTPVKLIGCIKNTAGVVELNADLIISFDFDCDRCAEHFVKELIIPMEHTLVNELNNEDNDELLLVEDMMLDIDELALSDILLNLPMKFLCSDSCKGVCAGCGKNLNKENCICKKEIDPRFEALRALLDDSNS